MKVNCPSCRQLVPAQDIFLDKGWGKCEACNEVFPLAQVLPAYSSTETHSKRPFDARALVEKNRDELVVHVPAMGMRAAVWGLLTFAIFWLGFVAFWTTAAGGFFFGGGFQAGNLCFASFSIPFWLVGFGMLGAVIWMARGTKTVRLNHEQMSRETRCWIWSRSKQIDIARVQYARLAERRSRSNSDNGYNRYSLGVEIVYEKGSFWLPVDSVDEQKWLTGEINEFLKSVQGKS
jgi:hypothetical protein